MFKKISLLVLVMFCTDIAFGGTVKNYSADVVETGSGMAVGKVYAAEPKFRMEMYDENGNLEGMSIIRPDQKKMYVCQSENKTYFEIPIDGSASLFENMAKAGQSFGIVPDIKREKQGTETVIGYKTDKYRTVTTINAFGQKLTTVVYEWMAAEFEYPVRIQTEDGAIVEMRNIKTGAQNASLFEIPSGWTKDSSAAKMMESIGSQIDVLDLEEMFQGMSIPFSNE
ncbi:MAG: DUF4412 domain-containing protein [Endomicrobia bacterium]|nr:DUF4412 domain-containing protein [Endomicrobiia bacterium]